MPDYDPKSIPILDDIIDDDIVKDDKKDPELKGSENPDIENEQADSLDLFTAATTDIEDEAAEPAIGAIDQINELTDDGTVKNDTETIESALIDYHTEDTDIEALHDAKQPEIVPQEEIEQYDTESTADISIIEPAIDAITPEPIPPIALETIVDDVVKQLIPDLEQQLRFLVQQALEEKLPTEIIEQISADEND